MKTFKLFFIKTIFFGFIICNCNLFAQTWPPFGMQGNGTEGTPWQITTPAHLETLANFVNAGNGNQTKDVYYILMNDINLSGYAQGEGWTPIGKYPTATDFSKSFQGNFNGNGFIVQNLTINRPTEDYLGLFGGTSDGNIQNIGIENCNIVGQGMMGGLVGQNGGAIRNGSNINNCYATGNIKGGDNTGGLVGIQSGGSIQNCYAKCNIVGTWEYIGGLAGKGSEAVISYCYATGSVKANNFAGGLVGYYNTKEISNCFAANDSVVIFNSGTNIYRVGRANTLRNNYARNDMVIQNTEGDVPVTNGLTTKDGMGKDISVFYTVDFFATASNWYNEAWDITSTPESNPEAVWFINDGEDFPLLMWQSKEGIGIKENNTTLEIAVYPNPTTGELRIELTSEQVNKGINPLVVEVFDIYGRNVTPLTSHLIPLTSVDISTLSSGVYFVRISTKKGVVNKKVVKY